MELKDYLKSLIPNFEKDRIMEDIRLTTDELRNVTIPAYKQAEFFGKGWVFKSDRVLSRVEIFNSLINNPTNKKPGTLKLNRNGIIATIYDGLLRAQVNLATAEEKIEKVFTDEIIGAGLTFYKANLVQFTEAVHFVSRFARRWLNYVYAAETSTFPEQPSVDEALIPADVEWIETNFKDFCNALVIVSYNSGDFDKLLEKVPDIIIDESNTENLKATLGESTIDPLQMGFIPVSLNPIYHIQMAVATWQTNRYHAAKNEIKCLSLRKANLEALSAGKPNPKVQKEIDYIEDRIQGLMRKNAEMERRYG